MTILPPKTDVSQQASAAPPWPLDREATRSLSEQAAIASTIPPDGLPLHIIQWWSGKRVVAGTLGPDLVFRKTTRHMLQKPPAHALDREHVGELTRCGCRELEITHEEVGRATIYRISFDAFLRHGFQIERGHAGPQVACPVGFFSRDLPQESRGPKPGEIIFRQARKPRQRNAVKPDPARQMMLRGFGK